MIGCVGEILPPESRSQPAQPDSPAPVMPEILDSFAEPLRPITDTPIPSLATAGSIELWVSETGFHEYSSVHARARGSHVRLPVGTTVLRVVRDERGAITKYTALIQREPGFDPPADLWFAAYDSSGTPLQNDDGSALQGKAPSCLACHLTRAEDGYVFGRTDD